MGTVVIVSVDAVVVALAVKVVEVTILTTWYASKLVEGLKCTNPEI